MVVSTKTRGPGKGFRQRDVTRALRAAARAGIRARVDITKEGLLSLIPLDVEASQEPKAKEWDDAIAKTAVPVR